MWWLPNKLENRVAGTLSYEATTLPKLELGGILNTPPEAQPGESVEFQLGTHQPPIIWESAMKGKR